MFLFLLLSLRPIACIALHVCARTARSYCTNIFLGSACAVGRWLVGWMAAWRPGRYPGSAPSGSGHGWLADGRVCPLVTLQTYRDFKTHGCWAGWLAGWATYVRDGAAGLHLHSRLSCRTCTSQTCKHCKLTLHTWQARQGGNGMKGATKDVQNAGERGAVAALHGLQDGMALIAYKRPAE